MGALDFLRMKEFQVSAEMLLNEKGSGGWEVELSQGGERVVVTLFQLERIVERCRKYANGPPYDNSDESDIIP